MQELHQEDDVHAEPTGHRFKREVSDRPSRLSVKRVVKGVCIPSQNGRPRNPGLQAGVGSHRLEGRGFKPESVLDESAQRKYRSPGVDATPLRRRSPSSHREPSLVHASALSKTQFLLPVNLIFLALACFLDTPVMLLVLVLVPILILTARALAVDRVHFGARVETNMMIGLTTPPFGRLAFVINALTGISMKKMITEGRVFIFTLIVVALLVTLFLQLVLWLPQSMGYGAK